MPFTLPQRGAPSASLKLLMDGGVSGQQMHRNYSPELIESLYCLRLSSCIHCLRLNCLPTTQFSAASSYCLYQNRSALGRSLSASYDTLIYVSPTTHMSILGLCKVRSASRPRRMASSLISTRYVYVLAPGWKPAVSIGCGVNFLADEESRRVNILSHSPL